MCHIKANIIYDAIGTSIYVNLNQLVPPHMIK